MAAAARFNVNGLKRIVVSKPAAEPVFTAEDVAAMCQSVVYAPKNPTPAATKAASPEPLTSATLVSPPSSPLPPSHLPFPTTPVAQHLHSTMLDNSDASDSSPEGPTPPRPPFPHPDMPIAAPADVSAVVAIASVVVPAVLPAFQKELTGADALAGLTKERALDDARRVVPVFTPLPSFKGPVVFLHVMQPAKKDKDVGQMCRCIPQLTDGTGRVVPMPRICVEFEDVQDANSVVKATVLSYVHDSVVWSGGTKPTVVHASRTHLCVALYEKPVGGDEDDGVAPRRCWAVSACSALGSFAFVEMAADGAAVLRCCGVRGKGLDAAFFTNTDVVFGDVPPSVKLLAVWFMLALNGASSRFAVTITNTDGLAACREAVAARVKAYNLGQTRVRTAGSKWSILEAKATAAKPTRGVAPLRSKKAVKSKAVVEDVRKSKKKRSCAGSAVDDPVRGKKRSKANADFMLQMDKELEFEPLKAMLCGEKLAVRI